MTKLPSLTGKEVIKALRKAGFEEVRIKGSHHFLRHADGRTTVVPVHAGETIGSGLMSKALRDCEMKRDETSFRAYCKGRAKWHNHAMQPTNHLTAKVLLCRRRFKGMLSGQSAVRA